MTEPATNHTIVGNLFGPCPRPRPSPRPTPRSTPTWFFTAWKAVRCRVFTAFSHYLWTTECNAFCPETCPESHPESRRKPIVLADVRRRHCLIFGSRLRRQRHGQDHAKAQRSLKSFWGTPGGGPGGTDAL